MENGNITWDQLKHKLERGERLLVLDVRDSEKYAKGSMEHPNLSVENLPYVEMINHPDKAKARLASTLSETEIVTVCTTGNKAGKAAAYLCELGYSAVSLDGGLTKYYEIRSSLS